MNLAIYIIGMLSFLSGFYFVKKSETKWNGVCGLFIAYVVWIMVQSLAGIFKLFFRYPVRAWQYGLLGLGLGIYCWVQVFRSKERQQYEYALSDFLIVLLLIVLGLWRYGI